MHIKILSIVWICKSCILTAYVFDLSNDLFCKDRGVAAKRDNTAIYNKIKNMLRTNSTKWPTA